jgi:hypothetical protein
LDIKKIFKNKKFISLDEKILKRINDWLETFYKFEDKKIKDGEEFFVEKEGEITNIVKYEDWMLRAKRRI